MANPQVAIRTVLNFAKRRWKYPVIAAGAVAILCAAGALTLAKKYQSTTTILVRPDQTLNQVSGFEMQMAFEEQLRNFDEIIYSRSVLEAAADSLGLAKVGSIEELELQKLMADVRSNITTQRLGSDSFKITYWDTDPKRSKRGAEVIASLFIKTKISVVTREGELAVQFYEKKTEEYRADLDQTVQNVVSSVRQRVQELPVETRGLYTQMEETERSIRETQSRLRLLKESAQAMDRLPELLETDPAPFRREGGKQQFFDLERSDVPYASELRSLTMRYDEVTRRFQGEYPEVVRLERLIADVIRRMRTSVNTEITRLSEQLSILDRRRNRTVDELQQSSVTSQQSQEKQSTFEVKRRLYEEMKLKLEQARLNLEVSKRGANQFVILDPPVVPVVPAKPNRKMIVIAGTVLGFILGLLVAFLAEYLDTTIRGPADVEVYQKPVIAFLPERARTGVRSSLRKGRIERS